MSTRGKGYFGKFKLLDWFYDLPPDLQAKLRHAHEERVANMLVFGGNSSSEPGLDTGTVGSGGESAADLLRGLAGYLAKSRDMPAAEMLFEKALSVATKVVDRHFVYNDMIDFHYKLRDSRPNALTLCEIYCKEDIAIVPQVIRSIGRARMPSFQRLAIIYEKQGRYEDAMEVCQLAMKLKMADGTKSGFKGRIEKLRKKQAKARK